MHRILEDLHKLYRKNLEGRDRAFCQLHPAQSHNGKDAGWSTQEVVEHLVLTYRNTGTLLDRYIERNSPTRRRVHLKHRFLQLLVIRFGGFPRGVPAPEFVRPGNANLAAMTGDELTTLMRSELETMDSKVEKCRECFDASPLASHFVFGPLTADQWRRFHFVHGRHHLAQLKRIRKQTLGAPPTRS